MNGIHDLGGMHGFGPVMPEPGEPVFHADWERRVFGMATALFAQLRNGDAFRHAIERMDPECYLATSYYEHWLHAIETLLLERGIITRAELGDACVVGETVSHAPARSEREAGGKERLERRRQRARFKRGDHIVTRNLNPAGHTRLPRYARGRPGVVTRDLGISNFPDTHAHGAGNNPQHCYTVSFRPRDLWGDQANARDRVYIDLWEDYLAPARVPRRIGLNLKARSRRR